VRSGHPPEHHDQAAVLAVADELQPHLHELVGVAVAPTFALSGPDGQIRPDGAQGLFHADARALSQAVLDVDGYEPEPIGHTPQGPGAAWFVSLPRRLGDPGPDPTVRIDRHRRIAPGRMHERIEIASNASAPVTATVTLTLACDFAPMDLVKAGAAGAAHEAVSDRPGELAWQAGSVRIVATAEGARAEPGRVARFECPVTVPPGGRVRLGWEVTVEDPEAVVVSPARPVEWSRPQAAAADNRLVRLLQQSLDDLESLRLAEASAPQDAFLGAGVPWYLTLFGRDSIWAARMMLPLGTDLAASTLRVLARRQGHRTDPVSGEAPGKIMHELRRDDFVLAHDGLPVPAAYYGTVDATPLWVNLLHDAWRWGLADSEVAALLPHLQAALTWLGEHADVDGDGFLEYADTSGHGLSNQGWKDSGDAVRFRDGSQAAPPIALVEVQGYAYEAARNAAALLEAFGLPGAERWRDYAEAMAERFRARFWVDGPDGGYPALALDAAKRPVDALTSNIGHLLGTGLLTEQESARVAELLASPAMAGGYGLRTMSAEDGGFNPLSYHCGSVWAHDTAIAVAGLARSGFGAAAARLADGLLAAGESFGFRLPELHAGDGRDVFSRPLPYPAACRPQAWSAAAAVALVHAVVGLHPDVPNGRVLLRPLAGAPLGAVSVRGLKVAGADVTVTVDQDGGARVSGLPSGMTLDGATPVPGI
jgi:glycogen debranching enzyme